MAWFAIMDVNFFELTLNVIELNVIELNIIELNIIELIVIELIDIQNRYKLLINNNY